MTDHEAHPAIDRQAAAALLHWFVEAGVDAILQDAPRDRFAETQAEASERRSAQAAARPAVERVDAPAPAPVASRRPSGTAAPSTLPLARPATDPDASDARMLAAAAGSLDELRAALERFSGCGLKATATSLVFGDGDPEARLMIVGEAPGREEDLAGLPFVGRSGQLLERMLAAIGLQRASVRITNTVPWRPPGNRTPTPAETEICRPFLMRQIELVRPAVVLCVGSASAKTLMGSDEGILRVRGRWSEIALGEEVRIPLTATLHPAYLLRQPGQKRLAWRDLLAVQQRLAGLSAASSNI